MKTHRLVHSDRSPSGQSRRRGARLRLFRFWPAALLPALTALFWWWKKKRQKSFQDGINTGWVQSGSGTQTGGSSGTSSGGTTTP